MARSENTVMTMQPEDESSSIWTERTQKPDESFDKKYWRKIFIASCFLAVLVDPLFLYVPILMDDFKCLMLDPKLKITALILRTITDLFYLMDIIIRIYRHENYSSSLFNELDDRQNFRWKSSVRRIAKIIRASIDILIDIVALLPLPQVAILIFFSKMSDLRYMTKRRMVIMNIFALSQYVTRVLRIYLSFMELKRTPKEEITETSVWIKGVLNFSMYIMASHVLGAMWYFFAIQRMMRCWHSACRKDDGCDNRIFHCHDHHAFRNTTILNDLCPLNSSDTMPIDFGIFATVLQYGIVGSTDYFQKFSNCFWWGLQHLSSFGSNLQPSADGWENLFTALVSIIGLLLFLYLIGNLQMYMQIAATRTEDHKHRMVMEQKRKEIVREIELLLFKNGNPTSLIEKIKSRIMGKVKEALEESVYANLDSILPLLPPDLQSHIQDARSLAWLKKVPMLQGMDEGLLKIIYEKLEPVRYTENNFIIQKGEIFEKMVYIVDGVVSIEERSSNDLSRDADAGELFGEELLRWPFYSDFPSEQPSATESVKTTGVVEALALTSHHLKRMPVFQNMEESVLKQICSHLRPMKYFDGENIIARGDPIQVLFIVAGYISDQSFNQKGPGEFYGEELLDWPFSISFPRRVPTVAESPYAVSECIEVLVLTAVNMERVATKFRKHFIKNYGRLAQKVVNYASPTVTMPGPSSSEAVVRFTEEDIKEATSNYSCLNYENEGGYGAVYEAALPGSETPVAIKTSNSADIGNRFIQSQHLVHEAFVLSQIRHKNVVRLLGCCLETKWPIMVYDRTSARTLEEHIHMNRPKLLLQQRMNIAAETAGALAYLHSMSVIHQDVKTENILIDHTTHIAKVSGFGASRLLHEDKGEMEYVRPTLSETRLDDGDNSETEDEVSTSPELFWDEATPIPEPWGEYGESNLPESSGEAEVSTLPGTLGYLDPEYRVSHVLTEKSDVYSFGVVLVELLTSQKAVSSNGPERFLADAFVRSVQRGLLHQILDCQVIKDNFTIAEEVSNIAVACLRKRGQERPSMKDVAAKLDTVVQTIMTRANPSTVENNISSGSGTSE
ncbi:uncharacterized protein LOC125480148 isoform X2 [Pyrus x bretschneideri]|uniref:uncharacterized protein LOC125480148 isoform X2 n=1 Tax=Pyrus x bretschneideri TaxID=225117 RepID=UPI002030974C|nr:uncharacterized protein LOC125480148 isoform X2 [Pyrus x bretschneideri]